MTILYGSLITFKDEDSNFQQFNISKILDSKENCGSSFINIHGGTVKGYDLNSENINVEKVFLDAAFTVKMGIKTKPFEFIFTKAIKWLQSGKSIPKFLMDPVMGKDNNSIVKMLYKNVSSTTISSHV